MTWWLWLLSIIVYIGVGFGVSLFYCGEEDDDDFFGTALVLFWPIGAVAFAVMSLLGYISNRRNK